MTVLLATPPPSRSRLLNADDVAFTLKCSRRSVWRLVARGLLQPVRLSGKMTRFRLEDVRGLAGYADDPLPAEAHVEPTPAEPVDKLAAVQDRILAELAGRALRSLELAAEVRVSPDTLYKALVGLKATGQVVRCKDGWHRPDCPPPGLVGHRGTIVQ